MSGNARMLGAKNGYSKFEESIYSDKLLMIIFNSAIKNIENAIKAIEENNFNRAHVQVIIAQEMITKWALSFPQDFPEAKNLAQTYEHLQSKLSDANIKKDTGILTEIRNFIILLGDTYREEEESPVFSSLSEIPLARVFSETG